MTTDITAQDIRDHAASVFTYMSEYVIAEPFRLFYSNNKVEDNGYGDYVFHLVMNSSGNKLYYPYALSYIETTMAVNSTYDPDLMCKALRQNVVFDAFCTGTTAAYYDTFEIQSVPNNNDWVPPSDYPNLTELKLETILGVPTVIHVELNLLWLVLRLPLLKINV